MLNTSDADQKI